ncbi:MAG: peptidylprolyl isomerase [Thalassobius sp.]|nr:peptidylprolyl isomerase [Thalassovita sp.]
MLPTHLKHTILCLLPALCLFLGSCEDDGDGFTLEEQAARDEAIIQDFLEREEITNYQRTSSGMYYIQEVEGEGAFPTTGDSVVVEYTGRLLNGKKFDSTRLSDESFGFVVDSSSVIQGWQEGIKLMKPGGTTRFLIPSTIAYGATQQGSIPPNSILDFEIELLYFE